MDFPTTSSWMEHFGQRGVGVLNKKTESLQARFSPADGVGNDPHDPTGRRRRRHSLHGRHDVGGLRVRSADSASGRAALAKLEQNPEISHLVTDLQMPGMDGYELARRAIAVRPGLEVIVTSGTDRTGQGFVFLPKPFSMTELQSVFGV